MEKQEKRGGRKNDMEKLVTCADMGVGLHRPLASTEN